MTHRSATLTPRNQLCCVVVEDQTMFLQLLTGMLRTVPGIHVRATASTVREAIATCRELPVDLLILDLTLPDGHGLDVLRTAVDHRPGLECIVLSSAAGEFTCPQALLPNIRALVDKAQAYERLQAVIARVVGDHGIDAAETAAPVAALRPRELEVFQLIGQGLKTADISDHMGISKHTVETHRKNIAAKLGASGAELVRLATIHNQTSLPRAGAR